MLRLVGRLALRGRRCPQERPERRLEVHAKRWQEAGATLAGSRFFRAILSPFSHAFCHRFYHSFKELLPVFTELHQNVISEWSYKCLGYKYLTAIFRQK